MSYTFGDSDSASKRLRKLADVYQQPTRALLDRAHRILGNEPVELAVDLGCGPGWSTALLDSVLRPVLTAGLDASERYIIEARSHHPRLKFLHHDALQLPFPVSQANVLLCRFLLTHLESPSAALQMWTEMAAPGALLVIHETECLESSDPTMNRYYEMVAAMQNHYGQDLNVGANLEGFFEGSGWAIIHSECLRLELPAKAMAELHLPNLRTWSTNEFAQRAFRGDEVTAIESALDQIASGTRTAPPVRNRARQMIARFSANN